MQATAAIKHVPVSTWHVFLAKVEHDLPAAATHQDLVEAYQRGRPRELIEAVAAVRELGTDEAREELWAASPRLGTEEYHQLGAAELALRLWTEGLASEQTAALLQRVRAVMRARASTRTVHMYRAGSAVSHFDVEAVRRSLAELIGPRLEAEGFQGEAEVHAQGTPNEIVQFTISRGSRTRERRIITKKSRQLRRQAEEEDDSLKLIAGRTLKVIASRGLAKIYQEALGEAVAGRRNAFEEPLMFDLQGLVRGELRLDDHGIADLLDVRLVELEVAKGDTRFQLRSPDSEQEVRLLAPYLESAEARSAVLRFRFSGRQQTPVRAKLVMPNHISISNPVWESHVDRFIDAVALTRSATASKAVRTLWEAAVRPLSYAEGYDTFGRRWQELIAHKIYRELAQPTARAQAMPAAGRRLAVNRDDGEAFGVSDDSGISSGVLTPTDIRAYELDLSTLAASIGCGLGLVDGARELEEFPGVYDLGIRRLRTETCSFYLVSRELSRELWRAFAYRLALEDRSRRNFVLCPKGYVFESLRAQTFELIFPWSEPSTLFPEIVRRFSLESEVDAVDRVSRSIRVVVDYNQQGLWFDGVKVEGIVGQSFDMLTLLARRASQGDRSPLSEEQVAKGIRAPEPGRVRQLLKPVEAKTKAAFAAVGREVPSGLHSWFKAPKGQGYWCNQSAAVF